MPGRCEGCGKTGSPCKIRDHTLECEKWQALYAADPATALDPEASWRRWQDTGRSEERRERIGKLAAIERDLQAAAAARFTRPPDILED